MKKHKPLSRQALSKYFERISQYIWDNFVVDLHPAFQEKDVFDELIDLIYGNIDKISSHLDLYKYLDDFPFHINEKNIGDSLMFYLLSNRSKITRGFTKEKFYLEFSRVYFICAVIEVNKIEIPTVYSAAKFVYSRTGGTFYSADRELLHKISDLSVITLLNNLQERPM